MIEVIQIPQITCVGANGSATGNQTSQAPVNGRLLSVYTDYSASSANTTVVTITTTTPPIATLFTIPAGNTDRVDHPRVQVCGITGTALTLDGTRIATDAWAINGYVKATVTLNDSAQTVDVYLVIEK